MKRTKKVTLVLGLMALALFANATVTRAALEDTIPAGAVAVARLHEPAAALDTARGSKLYTQITQGDLMPELADAIRKIQAGARAIERRHDVNVDRIVDDMFAGDVAVAILGKNTGVLLVEGRSPSALERAAGEVLRIQQERGEVTGVETRTFMETTIHITRMADGQPDRAYALLGKVLVGAKTGDMQALKRVIKVYRGEGKSLADSARYRKTRSLMDGNALATAYVDMPRLLRLLPKDSDLKSDPGGRLLRQWLETMRSAALSVTAKDSLRAHLAVQYKGGSLPPAAQALLPEEGAQLEVLESLPPSSAAAMARSTNLGALWRQSIETIERLDPHGAAKLREGMDAVVGSLGGIRTPEQLFDELGNEIAWAVLPPNDKNPRPAVALIVRLNETRHIPLALETLAGTAVTAMRKQGRTDVKLTYETYRDVSLTTVRGTEGTWEKISPTLCTVGKNLTVTTSVDAARRVIDSARSEGPELPAMEGTLFAAGGLDSDRLMQMIRPYRSFLVEHSVRNSGKSRAKARRDLRRLEKILSLVDKVAFTASYRDGRTDRVLEILPAEKVR